MGRRSKIFISYRRDDASDAAGRVYDRLAQKFGAKRIFMDVDSIQRGHDFREVLESHLAETAVLLVLIGRQWLDLTGPDGSRRLDDPSDFVRLEIATALRDKIPVIPVLLNDATMPTASVLPDDISGLAYRQASKLRHESFRTDILDLQEAVKDALGGAGGAGAAGSGRGGLIAASLLAALAIGGGAYWFATQPLVLESGQRVVVSIEEQTDRNRTIQAALKTLGFYEYGVDGEWGRFSEAALRRFQEREGLTADGAPSEQMRISLNKAVARQAEQEAARQLEERRAAERRAAEQRRQEAEARKAAEEKKRRLVLYRDVRAELKRLGDFSGALDGDWDAVSESALKSFEKREGLTVRGAPTEVILTSLKKATRPATFADRLQALPQGESLKECEACPEMVAIPGGSFTMGSPASEKGRQSNEGSQRRVTIQPFAIGKFEVTFAEWDDCVADGGCGGYRPKDGGWGRGDRPVINVSWQDAQAYVSWLNSKVEGSPYRLPSEAEWEYAARAGTTGRFSNNGGERELCAIANHADRSTDGDWGNKSCSDGVGKKTASVGRYRPNPFGLYDVHGNVWEWSEDCWNDSYSGAPSDGSPWKSGDCSRSVFRGGSWNHIPQFLRSALRDGFRRADRSNGIGFRVARTHRGRP